MRGLEKGIHRRSHRRQVWETFPWFGFYNWTKWCYVGSIWHGHSPLETCWVWGYFSAECRLQEVELTSQDRLFVLWKYWLLSFGLTCQVFSTCSKRRVLKTWQVKPRLRSQYFLILHFGSIVRGGDRKQVSWNNWNGFYLMWQDQFSISC